MQIILSKACRGPLLFITLFSILLLSGWLRFSALDFDYHHPDEPIGVAVVAGVVERGTLDTNWIIYDVPQRFKKRFHDGQYNFSSYYITLVLLDRIASSAKFDFSLREMRAASMAMSVTIVFATFGLGWRLGGNVVGLSAALMAAASSQLYHDSLYARPEAFFTLLTLGAMYAAVATQGRSFRLLAISSAIIGFLVACKISAALLIPVPGVIFLLMAPASDRLAPKIALVSSLGIVAGAFIGVPYAFFNPEAFIAGTMGLLNQYSTGGGPLGLHDGSYIERIAYLINYLGPTLGWSVIIFAAVGIISSRKNVAIITIGMAVLFSIFYLGTKPAFFERNFSHCLPFVYIFAGFGIKEIAGIFGRWRLVAATVLLIAAILPGATLIKTIRYEILAGETSERVSELRVSVKNKSPTPLQYIIWPNLTYGEAYPALRTHLSMFQFPYFVEFFDHDDRYSKHTLNIFKNDYRVKEVGKYESPFTKISTSTLQQYLAGSHVVYLVEGVREY